MFLYSKSSINTTHHTAWKLSVAPCLFKKKTQKSFCKYLTTVNNLYGMPHCVDVFIRSLWSAHILSGASLCGVLWFPVWPCGFPPPTIQKRSRLVICALNCQRSECGSFSCLICLCAAMWWMTVPLGGWQLGWTPPDPDKGDVGSENYIDLFGVKGRKWQT